MTSIAIDANTALNAIIFNGFSCAFSPATSDSRTILNFFRHARLYTFLAFRQYAQVKAFYSPIRQNIEVYSKWLN